MTTLKQILPGLWIVPETVQSVVAIGKQVEFGKENPPHVTLRAKDTAISWSFETCESAVQFADKLAGLIVIAAEAAAKAGGG